MGFLQNAKTAGKAPAPRPGPSTASKPAVGKRAPAAGRYSGLGAATPRDPRLRDGRYQVRVDTTGAFDGRNHDFFNIKGEILAKSEDAALPVGTRFLVSYMVDKGDMRDMNGPKVVSFTMTALRFETEEAFREAFPVNSQAFEDLMNRVDGVEIACEEISANPLGGAVLMVQALGNGRHDERTGEEYQDYSWFVNEE